MTVCENLEMATSHKKGQGYILTGLTLRENTPARMSLLIRQEVDILAAAFCLKVSGPVRMSPI